MVSIDISCVAHLRSVLSSLKRANVYLCMMIIIIIIISYYYYCRKNLKYINNIIICYFSYNIFIRTIYILFILKIFEFYYLFPFIPRNE